ncbi:MAG: hypothetical protein CVU10_01210 [Bacteroidetes bacterium HGW-Bacteroidetes-5]|jgi:V/A-type H+-transporting ATPase subunit I|nr:MAG: hypothetical protein CVU10_01210 [Bacteroidetes bacterium HGW-Bacteroidetes-5]
MIVKMDKYSFIVFHKELDPFLERVQELGMVDISRENKAIDDHSRDLFAVNRRYLNAIKRLRAQFESANEEDQKSLVALEGISKFTDNELLNYTQESLNNKDLWEQESEQLKREYEESGLWGIFHKEEIARIEKIGYTLHLYSVSEKSFKPEWESEYVLQILNQVNGKIYFAILVPKGEEFRFELPESKQPQRSCDLLKSRLEELNEKIIGINKTILSLSLEIGRLEGAMKNQAGELDLYLAGQSSLKEAEGTIALLTGFAPVDNRETIKAVLDSEGIYYLIEEAVKADNPPVKLKNNFFARLYEPIGDLYMLPKYGELDLTPYFAPFYMLFFGLCLGDMGYGLVLLIGSTIAKFKLKKFRGYLTLIQFLGLGAVLMASLSGVFFGASLKDLIPMPDSVKELFFSDLKMFWFAIVFGLFQIVFARLLNAVYSIISKGWQYGMNNIGWSILIVWAALKYASTMSEDITVPLLMNYAAIGGAFLILAFSSDSKNIFARIGSGVVAFWDVTSLFGDMLSYIRLFGLGTAGAILGMVVNSVAISMSSIPYMGWFLAALMLLVGHLLVLMLSSLGAFVHPMRLTFVEFYKNASFAGGGRPFRPLGKEPQ